MNAKMSVFAICIEAITYLLLHNCMTVPLKLGKTKLMFY